MKKVMLAAGHVSTFLGVLGIFLPLLPTTPFLLLSAFLYARSSEKFHSWLVNHKHLGGFIRNYTEKKGIPLQAKITAIIMIWLTIGLSAVFFVPVLAVKILLLLIAAAVTAHILSFKTL